MISTSLSSMRFPPKTESEFLHRYHLRAAKNSKLVMMLGLLLYTVGAQLADDPWYLRLIGLIGPIVGLILCETKSFYKYTQTLGTAGYITFFVLLDASLSHAKPSFHTGYLSFITMMNVFVVYTMLRLFFLPSIVAALALTAAHILLLQSRGASTETIEAVAIGLFMANFVGSITSYQFERSFRQMFADKEDLTREHTLQERLLENILPRDIGIKLRNNFQDVVIECPDVIVLSADLANFTTFSTNVSAENLVGFLNEVYTEFDGLADRYKMTKVKTIGDAFILVSGVHSAPDLISCVNMAVSMRTALRTIVATREIDIDIRIGIARGTCSAGVVGELRPKFDVWGPAVTEAEQLEKTTKKGLIALSTQLQNQLLALREGRELLARADQPTADISTAT